MARLRLLVLASVTALVTASALAAQTAFPSRIDLPDGFQPEGIATAGEQFYVGSIPTGAVYRGSLRTGNGRNPRPAASGSGGDRAEGRPRAGSSLPAAPPATHSSTTRKPGRSSRPSCSPPEAASSTTSS